MPYRIAITTLGCKVNQADSDHLADAFRAAACEVVPADAPADAYVVNTCTVTLVADRKARKLLRGVARPNPQAVVAATGCYAEGLGRSVLEALPEVDLVRGTTEREALPQAVLLELRRRTALGLLRPLAQHSPTHLRPRVMLKVQDGCNHVCGFCIVPAVRGRHRSRGPAEVLDEVRRRVDEGVREFVLCGIRLGAYGWDWPGRGGSPGSRFRPLLDLLPAIARIPGVERLRLSSILPLDVGPDLFATMADIPQVCEHLHLPLQSGDDQVLGAMGRGYTARRFLVLVEQARQWLPDLALATDVLVGYPGETAAQFANTVAVCRAAGFADMHIFSYSPRPGTRAATLDDKVPPAEKQARSRALHDLRAAQRLAFCQPKLHRRVEVLVEEADSREIRGLTRDYVRVTASGAGAIGELAPVMITAVEADGLRGARC